MATQYRIAMLNADVPVPTVALKYATYGDVFHELLCAAASRSQCPVKVQSDNYDVKKGEYPDSLENVDALLISGSASSSYDDEAWITQLDKYIQNVYYNHPRVKIFGSCFGHQLICQSLLGVYGVKVEKDPNGWELGVREIQLEDHFRTTLAKSSTAASIEDGRMAFNIPEKMRLQFVHADHVNIPPGALPTSWLTVGHTEHCAVQGIYQPGRILTLQGHFEFDRFINSELIKVFGAKWPSKDVEDALEAMDKDDDAKSAAEMVLRFMLDDTIPALGANITVFTPPLEK